MMRSPSRHTLCCALLLVCGLAGRARGAATVYPHPAGLAPSAEYRVLVDGKEVFVFDNPVAALASFDLGQGPSIVEIHPRRDAKWVDIRPLSRRIAHRVEDNVIKVRLDQPANLSIELNRSLRTPLFLFANPPERARPVGPKVRVFEGGKVHEVGDLSLSDGETIYLAGGAVVRGSIAAKGAKDVRILGRGILDATGFGEREGGRRHHVISLRDSQNVEIDGIIVSNGVHWQIVPVNSDNVLIRNVKIVSDNGGDDGIDIVRSRNVTIDGVFAHTKDDCIAIKSIMDYPPEVGSENILVKNSVFWNAAWGNALEIGFELRSKFVRNIEFRNSDIIHVEDGAVFSIHNGDTSTVENVHFDDIRIEDARQKLFDVAIFYTQYSQDKPNDRAERDRRYLHGAWDGVLKLSPEEKVAHAPYRGHVRNISFRNIDIVDGALPFSIFWGYDGEHVIDGVTIENLSWHGRPLESLADLRVAQAFTRNLTVKSKRAKLPRRPGLQPSGLR